jgi:protein-L-isoaspartate(D-aspartate) O-methyltransferase
MPRTLTDYAAMRTWMVETQLRSRDIQDARVLKAFEVYTIERYASLTARARAALEGLGHDNVTCLVGDGSEGYPPESPYDGILVTAAAPNIPAALIEQLADGGRLVIPVGEMYTQDLVLVKKRGGRTAQKTINNRSKDD